MKFKALADKKKEVFDEDIEALVDEQLEVSRGMWELTGLQVTAGSNTIPTATVTLRDSNGQTVQDASIGDGPVDAIYSAIQRLTGVKGSLSDYRFAPSPRARKPWAKCRSKWSTTAGKSGAGDQHRYPGSVRAGLCSSNQPLAQSKQSGAVGNASVCGVNGRALARATPHMIYGSHESGVPTRQLVN